MLMSKNAGGLFQKDEQTDFTIDSLFEITP